MIHESSGYELVLCVSVEKRCSQFQLSFECAICENSYKNKSNSEEEEVSFICLFREIRFLSSGRDRVSCLFYFLFLHICFTYNNREIWQFVMKLYYCQLVVGKSSYVTQFLKYFNSLILSCEQALLVCGSLTVSAYTEMPLVKEVMQAQRDLADCGHSGRDTLRVSSVLPHTLDVYLILMLSCMAFI